MASLWFMEGSTNAIDLFLRLCRDPFIKITSGSQIFQAAKIQAADPLVPKEIMQSRLKYNIDNFLKL